MEIDVLYMAGSRFGGCSVAAADLFFADGSTSPSPFPGPTFPPHHLVG